MPRPLIASLFYSVDGVAEAPNLFQHDSFDGDLAELMTEAIARIDDCVLGRVTYQEWAGYWPGAEDGPDAGFARFINGTPKHVVSRTLTQDDLTWQNSTLIEGDLLDYVRALKETAGGGIAVQGSLSVVRQLIEAGLMDRLQLIIHPVVAGSGRGLFDGPADTRLELLEARSTRKGNVLVTYGPPRGPRRVPAGRSVHQGASGRVLGAMVLRRRRSERCGPALVVRRRVLRRPRGQGAALVSPQSGLTMMRQGVSSPHRSVSSTPRKPTAS